MCVDVCGVCVCVCVSVCLHVYGVCGVCVHVHVCVRDADTHPVWLRKTAVLNEMSCLSTSIAEVARGWRPR